MRAFYQWKARVPERCDWPLHQPDGLKQLERICNLSGPTNTRPSPYLAGGDVPSGASCFTRRSTNHPSLGRATTESSRSCVSRGSWAHPSPDTPLELDNGCFPRGRQPIRPAMRPPTAGGRLIATLHFGVHADIKRPMDSANPLAAGTTLGRYRIDALIGTGGMGAVYRV